ncbi:unnamed protein product [Urochloa humidicola]
MAGCSLVVGVARVMQRRRAIQGRVEVLPCRLAARVIPATAGSERSQICSFLWKNSCPLSSCPTSLPFSLGLDCKMLFARGRTKMGLPGMAAVQLL